MPPDTPQQKTYLDANGNPSPAPGGAQGKVYLDESGNPQTQPLEAPSSSNANQGDNRGFFSGVLHATGLDNPVELLKSSARRMLLGGFDPESDINFVRNLPGNAKAGAQSAADITVPTGNKTIDAINRFGSKAAGGMAGVLAPMVGVDPQSMRARADAGDTSGILGEAAVPTAAVLGGEAVRGIRSRLLRNSDINTYQRIISPGSTKASEQVADIENYQRARPYLSQQSRQSPVSATQSEGPLKGQRLGVMNMRQNAQVAGQNLWDNGIEPRASAYRDLPFNGPQVANDVTGTLDPNSLNDVNRTSAVKRVADFYGNTRSVGEALDKVRALNDDRQIQAYESALPDKQAEMLSANPELQGKIQARDSLLDGVFGREAGPTKEALPGSIAQYGDPTDAEYLRQARRDWGSLREVSKNFGNVQVPTPQSLGQRLANTVRGVITPSGVRGYISRPLETLFHTSDPNSLAEQLSNQLSRQNLQPRPMPPVPERSIPGDYPPEDAEFTDLPPRQKLLPAPSESTPSSPPVVTDTTRGAYTRVPGATPESADQFIHPPMPTTTSNVPDIVSLPESAYTRSAPVPTPGGSPLVSSPPPPVQMPQSWPKGLLPPPGPEPSQLSPNSPVAPTPRTALLSSGGAPPPATPPADLSPSPAPSPGTGPQGVAAPSSSSSSPSSPRASQLDRRANEGFPSSGPERRQKPWYLQGPQTPGEQLEQDIRAAASKSHNFTEGDIINHAAHDPEVWSQLKAADESGNAKLRDAILVKELRKMLGENK